MSDNVLEFTDGNFQAEVLDQEVPVLVDFWAPWCGPCKMIAPTVEELASEFSGRAKIGKLNTDDNPQIATQHQISAIPTLLLFKGGEIVDRFMGVTPKAKLSEALNKQVS